MTSLGNISYFLDSIHIELLVVFIFCSTWLTLCGVVAMVILFVAGFSECVWFMLQKDAKAVNFFRALTIPVSDFNNSM